MTIITAKKGAADTIDHVSNTIAMPAAKSLEAKSIA